MPRACSHAPAAGPVRGVARAGAPGAPVPGARRPTSCSQTYQRARRRAGARTSSCATAAALRRGAQLAAIPLSTLRSNISARMPMLATPRRTTKRLLGAFGPHAGLRPAGRPANRIAARPTPRSTSRSTRCATAPSRRSAAVLGVRAADPADRGHDAGVLPAHRPSAAPDRPRHQRAGQRRTVPPD